MKRLKSIASLAAGLMLAGSILGQSALAQISENGPNGNTTNVVVGVVDTGIFDAYFCPPLSLAQSPSTTLTTNNQPTASTAGDASGTLAVCYTDTKSHRPSFDTGIVATDFTLGALTIPASGFTIESVENVYQGQWGSANGVGDIGQFVNDGDYVAQNTLPQPWTTDNTLNIQRSVQFGYEGKGTIWSNGQFDVSLVLPAGTQAGTYTSVMTISILVGTQP